MHSVGSFGGISDLHGCRGSFFFLGIGNLVWGCIFISGFALSGLVGCGFFISRSSALALAFAWQHSVSWRGIA